MTLTLSILYDELQALQIRKNFPLHGDEPLECVRLYNPDALIKPQEVLCCTQEQLSLMNPTHIPKSLIVLCMDSVQEVSYSLADIIYVESDISLITLFSHIQGIFESYQAWYCRIQAAMIKNNDIEDVLNIIVEKLHNPIALFDLDCSVISWTGDLPANLEGNIWKDVITKGYTVDYFTYGEWNQMGVEMRHSDKPFLFRRQRDTLHQLLCCPLTVNGVFTAAIGIAQLNAPITDGQIQLVSQIKILLEQNIKFLSIQEASDPYYVVCLLNNVSVENYILEHYLQRRSWNMDDTYVLLNFSQTEPFENSEIMVHPYIKKLKELFPHGLHCSYENSVIVLLNLSRGQYEKEDVCKQLTELKETHRLQCSISSEFYRFSDLRYSYIQSKIILTQGRKAHSEAAYYESLDFYQQSIVSLLSSVTSIKALCHPRILEMRRSENPSRIVLIETLYSYLVNGCNVTKTASDLYIHRNTLLYRLNELTEQFHIDFRNANADYLFYLLFSCVLSNEFASHSEKDLL